MRFNIFSLWKKVIFKSEFRETKSASAYSDGWCFQSVVHYLGFHAKSTPLFCYLFADYWMESLMGADFYLFIYLFIFK